MESLYRKYRPLTFDSVVGQQHIVSTLEHAVTEGRLSHAYLFCGPRGTGKTTMARILAKALLCEHAEAARAQVASGCMPDGDCPECQAIAEGNHPDVYELDAASRTGVDNVREEIVNSVSFAPVRGAYKVYIIDEVHMLTTAAFNALLKTLEEPPAHVVFVLCTTDPQKIPETILSRCQRFDFHRISDADLVSRMRYVCEQEGFECDEDALEIVAKHARGGMRDALSTLEQLSVFGDGAVRTADARALLGEVASTVLSEFACKIAVRDTVGLFGLIRDQVDGGNDLLELTRDLVAHMRDVYTAAIAGPKPELFDGTPEEVAAFVEEAKLFENADRLARTLTVLDDAALEMRNASDPRLVLEIALTRLARPESDLTLESLAERIARLETQLAAGVPSGPMGTAGLAAATGGPVAKAQAGSAGRAPAAAAPSQVAKAAPTARADARSAAASQVGGVPWEKPAEAPRPVAASASQVAAAPVPQPDVVPARKPIADPVAAPVSAPVAAAQAQNPQAARPQTGSGSAPVAVHAGQPDAAQVHRAAPQAAPQAGSQTAQRPPVAQNPAGREGMKPASSASADLGDLQRKWSEVVRRAVAAQPSRGALLQSARAQADDGSTLTVVFPKGSSFALKMIMRADSQAVVLPIVAEVFGERAVEYVMDGGDAPAKSPAAVTPAAPRQSAAAAAPVPAVAAPVAPAAVPHSAPAPAAASALAPEPPAAFAETAPSAAPQPQAKPQPVAAPAVDQVSGPTVVPEPDVDAQRKAWEDEQVPYDDAAIAAYGFDDEEMPPFEEQAHAPTPAATAPAPAAPATPAPAAPVSATPTVSASVTSASAVPKPTAVVSPTPAATAQAADASAPVAANPFSHPGADIEETPQSEEEAKALIGTIFGAGVVFKNTEE